VPDDADYDALRWLIENPERWSAAELETAETLVEHQRRAVEEVHPKDLRGRRDRQALVDRLEAAVRTYRAGKQA
jgi:hypothetical protein